MMSINKQPTEERSSKNISKFLSKDMLAVILGFVDIKSLLTLIKLDKNFKSVITDKKILPIFTDFIIERMLSNCNILMDTNFRRNFNTSFIPTLGHSLSIKYNSFQADDFLKEIINSRINQVSLDGAFHLSNITAEDEQNLQILKDVFNALKVNKKITTLVLPNIFLGRNSKSIQNLSDALMTNKRITNLDLSYNKLGENSKSLQILSDALKMNKRITTLSLANNKLGENSKSLQFLSDALMTNKRITNLDLSNNELGENSKSLQFLSDALKVNKTITSLSLANNELGENSKSLQFLSDALKANKTITTLDLSKNELRENSKSLQILSDVLEVNKAITTVDLSKNYTRENHLKELGQLSNNLNINLKY